MYTAGHRLFNCVGNELATADTWLDRRSASRDSGSNRACARSGTRCVSRNLRVGDRVVVPFTISCGDCFFCGKGLYAACENTNPGRGTILNKKDARPGAGMFGYTHFYGGYAGGQAEYVRVPCANVGPLRLPDSTLGDEQVLFLSDILPTGYQAVLNAAVGEGSTLAIFGAGPVGLMAAACARLLGVERIFMIDHHPYRLALAQETYGVEPINFDENDDPEQIISATSNRGVDASIDAVGFRPRAARWKPRWRRSSSKAAAARRCARRWQRPGVAEP